MFRAERRADRKAGKDKRCHQFRSGPKPSSTFTKTSFQNQSNCVGDSRAIDHFAYTVAILSSALLFQLAIIGYPGGKYILIWPLSIPHYFSKQ